MKFYTFTLLGYPLRQRFYELWGPTDPTFGVVVGLSSVLDKFICFPIKRRNSKIRRSKDDWSRNFGPKFGTFWPL